MYAFRRKDYLNKFLICLNIQPKNSATKVGFKSIRIAVGYHFDGHTMLPSVLKVCFSTRIG
jgi:hypothetical protein